MATANMANIIAVSNETESSMTRMTKDGRKLTYEMKVLQQPARARACGSGAKSSADRRPVDPPPVVELRVYEGESKTDVTFSHNANFFLYTTLESARQIAPGRGNSVATPFPVLTGMPVAGMAYLDRPAPAGYFIFPDLSVRHEGIYRLSFNLFEELKESKDADPGSPAPRTQIIGHKAHVHFRLEVKSEPFVVFSAKKFPGLAESTALSRVVAEQGCRVRIRRDVRMRRRDNAKSSKEFDEYSEDAGTPYSRPERFATPDGYASRPLTDRARSVSNCSIDGSAPYPAVERRQSSHDVGYYSQPPYQQQASPAPVPQPAPANYGGHLSFGGSSTAQYQTPAVPSSIHPTGPTYPLQTTNYSYPPGSHSRTTTPSPQTYNQPPSPSYPHQPYQAQPSFHESQDYKSTMDYRRASNQSSVAGGYKANNGQSSIYQSMDNSRHSSTHSLHSHYQAAPNPEIRSTTPIEPPQVLPPLKSIQPSVERKYESYVTDKKYEQPLPPASTTSVPGSILSSLAPSYSHSPPTASQTSANSPPTTAPRSTKRSFGKVFDTTHLNQSASGGSRPDAANHGQDIQQIALDDGSLVDEDQCVEMKLLVYKRADGSRQHKKCPPIAH